jgi:hypothetical protein
MPCEDRGLIEHYILRRNFRRVTSLRWDFSCGVHGRVCRAVAVVRVLRVDIFIRIMDFTQESSRLELGMEGYLFPIGIYVKRNLRIEV